MKLNSNYVGLTFQTTNFGEVVVLEYTNNKDVLVEFKNTGTRVNVQLTQLKKGNIRDKEQPSVYNVGIVGDGIVKENGKLTNSYNIWRGMLSRCYNEVTQEKQPTYQGCQVSENFKRLDYFQKWCLNQKGFGLNGWTLDKDILSDGNLLYSEDTCCFVPQHVNNLFRKQPKLSSHPQGIMVNKYGSYEVYVGCNNTNLYFGSFKNEKEAIDIYKAKKYDIVSKIVEGYRDQLDERVYNSIINKFKPEVIVPDIDLKTSVTQ